MSRIEVRLPQLDQINHKLDQILQALLVIAQLEEEQMADLSQLQTEVAENTDAAAAAAALLAGLSQQLKDAIAANDPAAIQALVDQLDANNKALSDAVAANTPADPNAGGGDAGGGDAGDGGGGDSPPPEG